MTEFLGATGGIGGLFTALGLNVQAFVLDLVAFLITVYVCARWVFPPMTKALDAKKDELEAAAKHESQAREALTKAEASAAKVLAAARTSADEIIATAHADAEAQLAAARERASAQAERMITEAREQLAKDVSAARKELGAQTAKLVASATENLLHEKLDPERDGALIGRSLEVKR